MSFNRYVRCFRADKFYKTSYTSVPKAGCSTIQRLLANSWAIANDIRPISNPHTKRGRELIHLWDSELRPSFQELCSQTKFFTVVRNPYTRLLSAWLDKVQAQRKEGRAFASQHKIAEGSEITFSRFVDILADADPDFFDQHWAKQTSICNVHCIPYSHVGALEEMNQTIEWTTTHIPAIERNKTDYARHSTSASSRMTDFYDDQVASKVAKIYAEDFSTFGYSTDINMTTPLEDVAARTTRVSEMYVPNTLQLVNLHDRLVRDAEAEPILQDFLDLAKDESLKALINPSDWQRFTQKALNQNSAHLSAFLPYLLSLDTPKAKVQAAQILVRTSTDLPLARKLAQDALAQIPWLKEAENIMAKTAELSDN